MAANIAEIDGKVANRIRDLKPLFTAPGTAQRYDAIASALAEYQRIRPRVVAKEITGASGAGAFDYAVTSLTGYVDGFSVVLAVYYPYLATDQNVPPLDPERWAVVRIESGAVLRFFDVTPTSPDKFLAQYTTRHTLDGSTSTVPASDDEALADLGACFCLLFMAAQVTQETDNVIAADSMNRLSKAAEYRAAAKLMRQAYEIKLGIGASATVTAGIAVATASPRFSGGQGQRALFHG